MGDLWQRACFVTLSHIASKYLDSLGRPFAESLYGNLVRNLVQTMYLDNHWSLCIESVQINLTKVLHSNYIDSHGRPPAERRACRDQLVKSITYKLLDNHGRPLYRACIKTTLIVMGDETYSRAYWEHVKSVAFKLP